MTKKPAAAGFFYDGGQVYRFDSKKMSMYNSKEKIRTMRPDRLMLEDILKVRDAVLKHAPALRGPVVRFFRCPIEIQVNAELARIEAGRALLADYHIGNPEHKGMACPFGAFLLIDYLKKRTLVEPHQHSRFTSALVAELKQQQYPLWDFLESTCLYNTRLPFIDYALRVEQAFRTVAGLNSTRCDELGLVLARYNAWADAKSRHFAPYIDYAGRYRHSLMALLGSNQAECWAQRYFNDIRNSYLSSFCRNVYRFEALILPNLVGDEALWFCWKHRAVLFYGTVALSVRLSLRALRKQGLAHINDARARRGESPLDHKLVPVPYLNKLAVNFARHNLMPYDVLTNSLAIENRPHYEFMRKKLEALAVIAKEWPALAEECQRQANEVR